MNIERFLSEGEYKEILDHIVNREQFNFKRRIAVAEISIKSGAWNMSGREGEYCILFNSSGRYAGGGYGAEPEDVIKGWETYEGSLKEIGVLLKYAEVEITNEPFQLSFGGMQ